MFIKRLSLRVAYFHTDKVAELILFTNLNFTIEFQIILMYRFCAVKLNTNKSREKLHYIYTLTQWA